MLNLVNVPIPQAAKTVLGDILKLNYTVSDKLTGGITLQTTTPIDREGLVDAFEATLRANGAVVVKSGSILSILPAADAAVAPRDVAAADQRSGPGMRVLIIPLQHISAAEMKQILDPVQGAGSVLRVDPARNLLVVGGNKSDLANIDELVRVFDVDWMKGMSVGLYPIGNADAEVIAGDLEKVLGLDTGGPLSRMVRVIPNRRMNSVLVVSSKPHELEIARSWLKKLESVAGSMEPQLFVYKVQNRPTAELADVLHRVITADSGGGAEPTAETAIAPKFETIASVAGDNSNFSKARTGILAAGKTAGSDQEEPANYGSPGSDTPSDQSGPSGRASRGFADLASVRVTADEAKHALLVEALPRQYERIQRILERLDTVSTQVMLEAVIAEVSLSDELKFGVKWYFDSHPSSFSFTDAMSGAVGSAFPGFSYFFTASSMKMALDALSSVTKVNVVSAPSLMVLDNRKAVLQIGDSVPIISQTAQSVINPDSPIVNSVEMKDTGVILSVTPRVNDSGSVVLEVEQEVSNVAKTTSSGIDSPTIQQRRVKTTVVVGDGQVVALGGLIQQRDEVGKTQVPLLGNIPVIGAAFGTRDNTITRTELVIFIRPQVARDQSQAHLITEEYRSRINIEAPLPTRGTDLLHRDVDRILR